MLQQHWITLGSYHYKNERSIQIIFFHCECKRDLFYNMLYIILRIMSVLQNRIFWCEFPIPSAVISNGIMSLADALITVRTSQ